MNKQLRELKSRKAALIDQASALNAAAAAANRDLSDTELAQFDQLKAQIEETNRKIEAQQFLAEQQASLGVEVPDGTIRVSDNIDLDPKRGFASFGEFAKCVAGAKIGRGFDQRLGRMAAAPSTFGSESVGADGGFSIPPQFSSDIWRLSLGESSLIPLTQNTEVSGNSMIFPKDESTPWGGNGVQVYWQNEAAAASGSKPYLGTNTLVLHKMISLVPVTNELIQDGFAIGSYLSQVAPERIAYKANEAILYGDGVGKPFGALTSPAAVVQAKDAGQSASTLSVANIANMVSRLIVGELGNAIWIANPDLLPPLEALTVGNYPVFLPSVQGSTTQISPSLAAASYGMLKGRPLLLSEHAAAFSSKGDLNLLSLRGYRTITKAGGVQSETSMHLYFDADVTAFRFIFRINGMPILSNPITPPKSSNTRSHFVTLAAR